MSYRPHVLATIHEWDVGTFRRIVSRPATSPLVRIARSISHTGNGYLYPLIPLITSIAGLEQSLKFLKLALIAFGVERAIYLFAKNGFKRKRPANVLYDYSSVIVASDEFSFPSGHSSAAFLMVTLLVLVYGPAFVVLYVWAALVAISRVLLGVHFPTDILVGSVMGFTIAFLTCAVYL